MTNCLITTDAVKIMIDRDTARNAGAAGSALQNPDLSRAALAALLRRGPAPRDNGRNKAMFWSAFTAHYASTCANSN